MDFGTGSDPLLRIAFLSGVGALSLSLAMLAATALLRLRLFMRRRREARFIDVWRPIFAQCIEGAPARLPRLKQADHESFLSLWNHYHESLRGPSETRLNRLAVDTGMDEVVRAMLRGGSRHKRLLAILTLGNLRDRTLLPELRFLAEDRSAVVSLAAAHALLRIEPGVTLTWLLPLAAVRSDWPMGRLAAMLAEAGANRISVPLASAIKEAAGSALAATRVPRLLKLARVAHSDQLAATIRHVLGAARDDEVIASCVSQLTDPRDAELARRYAAHPAWFVRVAAARALGRLGAPEDRTLLTDMLADTSWWVRYRAGQALAGLVHLEELRRIRSALPDRYAAQMLDQVLAERT